MAEILGLSEAIAELVHDGDCVAMEGLTHSAPFAAGHEVIRQQRRHLTLVRLSPDVIFDQLIGMGCADKLMFSWAGAPGGSLHRFRDAVEKGWPVPLEIEEHTHAGLANRLAAAASGLPFVVMRGYLGTGLMDVTDYVKAITCPFTGEQLAAVAALRPDVAILHAQQADQAGNVLMWGAPDVQKETALAASQVLVTVEEIVERLDPAPGAIVLPSWVVTAVSCVPGGSGPSPTDGYSQRDAGFYQAWGPISRDRDTFTQWMEANVLKGAPGGAR